MGVAINSMRRLGAIGDPRRVVAAPSDMMKATARKARRPQLHNLILGGIDR
jgi:hypothetical protein